MADGSPGFGGTLRRNRKRRRHAKDAKIFQERILEFAGGWKPRLTTTRSRPSPTRRAYSPRRRAS